MWIPKSQTLNPQISLPSLRPSQLHRLWRHGRRDLPSKVTTTATNPTRKIRSYLLPLRFSLRGSRQVDVIIALGCHAFQLAPRDLGEGPWGGRVDMVVGSDSLITAEQRNKVIFLAWESPSSSLFPKPRVVRSSTAAPFHLYCRRHWSSLLLKCCRWWKAFEFGVVWL